jgi:hypothetical protein
MHITDNLATSLDTCHIVLSTGTILIEQELRGPSLAHGVEHLLEGVAAREEQQQYGDICLGGILHFNTFSLQRYKKLLILRSALPLFPKKNS